MRPSAVRLRIAFALLAWLAQAFMPVAHAAFMAAPGPAGMAWCGDPAMASTAMAALPDEVRRAIADEGVQAEHLAACTLLCAVGGTPPPVGGLPPTEVLRAAGIEPLAAQPCCPPGRAQSPTPPAHAPPARG